MAKYDVFQTRTTGFYQQVEASSIEEAERIAEELNDWEVEHAGTDYKIQARLSEKENA
jgi:hypothetical protein